MAITPSRYLIIGQEQSSPLTLVSLLVLSIGAIAMLQLIKPLKTIRPPLSWVLAAQISMFRLEGPIKEGLEFRPQVARGRVLPG